MKKYYALHFGIWIALMFLFAQFFTEGADKILIAIIIGAIIGIYFIFIVINFYYNSNIKRKKIYLAGPYSGTDEEIKQNILKAIDTARKLRNQGYNVFLPHSNFVYCDDIEMTEQGRREIMLLCKEWLLDCDLFALMPGWRKSKGAIEEFLFAQKEGKEIIYLT